MTTKLKLMVGMTAILSAQTAMALDLTSIVGTAQTPTLAAPPTGGAGGVSLSGGFNPTTGKMWDGSLVCVTRTISPYLTAISAPSFNFPPYSAKYQAITACVKVVGSIVYTRSYATSDAMSRGSAAANYIFLRITIPKTPSVAIPGTKFDTGWQPGIGGDHSAILIKSFSKNLATGRYSSALFKIKVYIHNTVTFDPSNPLKVTIGKPTPAGVWGWPYSYASSTPYSGARKTSLFYDPMFDAAGIHSVDPTFINLGTTSVAATITPIP